MKSFLSILLAAAILLSPLSASASYLLPEADTETSTAELTVSAPSVLLMEVSTGSVIYEKMRMKSYVLRASPKL